jgi:ABC-type bacteriocin/lantibiotic exporter with double-glycine peptidase domain
VGNWIPLITAFLFGLGWQKIRGIRKFFYLLPLASVCLYSSYGFFLESTLDCYNNWKDGVCLQSSEAGCGPACAASLLKFYYIESDEAEMATLCLSRNSGTRLYGLYRGLKIKTVKTQWDAEIFTWTLDELRAKGTSPLILRVRLEKNAKVDPRYQNEWGWIPGVTHTVLFYGFKENDKVEIGDPAVGREHWHVNSLKVLWHGQGIRLVPRLGS